MRCAIYCRLSKEDEVRPQANVQGAAFGTDGGPAESESIQNQKSMLVKYAAERGWEIYRLYCDEDFSGADARRPDFNRMLRDAEDGRFQIILCKSQSRFTRDMELVEKYIHGKFPLWGIRFVAVADNADTAVRGNKKARQINGLVNEWYLEDLSENIRMVFDFKRRQGQYIGAFPLYGYRKDPTDKNKLVVDEASAAVVRQIYRWCLEGNGARRIASLLNQRGLENPTVYKRNRGMDCAARGSGAWNRTSVSRILRNEMYTGVMVQGRRKRVSYKSKSTADVPEEQWYRVPGTHEAIIAPATFQQVQELLRPRVRTDGRGEVYALSGLVKCAGCGAAMTRTSNGRKGDRQVSYLRCRRSMEGACTRHSVRLEDLTSLTAQRLREHLAEFGGYSGRIPVQAKREQRAPQIQKELRTVEGEIKRRTAALNSLYLDRAAGMIDGEQFSSMNREFLAEKASLKGRAEMLRQELENLETAEKAPGELEGHIRELLKFDPVPRELFALTVEKIEVGERDPKTGRQDIGIHWKF